MQKTLMIVALVAATQLGFEYVDHFLFVNNGLPFDAWPWGRFATWDAALVALLYFAYL